MMTVIRNKMVRRAAATTRHIPVILVIMISLQNAAAQDGSPPASILINIEQPLTAGLSYEITCRAVDGETPPDIFWWLGDRKLHNSIERTLVTEDGNETVSILLLTPSPDDNGQTLKCQAKGARGVQEKSVELLVHYAPIVALYMDRPPRPDGIREWDNITLKCYTQSNPPTWSVKWMLQGHPLKEITSSGPLNHEYSLRLNDINRTQAGNYTCIVSNAIGDTESSPLRVTVKYRPVCRLQHPMVYAVALGDDVELDCAANAVPPATSYHWMFSQSMMDAGPYIWHLRGPSGEMISYVEWASGVSWRNHQPTKDTEYGTFFCTAKNTIGEQLDPCVFHVVPPGLPDAPSNCSVLNETTDSFAVQCSNSTDVGFRQSYQLEVFDVKTGNLMFNKTQKSPVFLVDDIEPNQDITMRIAAISPRGRSGWTRMNIFRVPFSQSP
ncbi:nephrin-like isoform X1 [Schistocerca piceifrons]|uniref:nephrin-like isoform X1 n=2 Tax=Schistocerca piceifrons TaxID=274613 RepID=UPI001F5E4B7B|nr:nephrin-like isoform X1 [Schistocerca piceifrons]XP_047115139.1 nephrin-like isoform X1 [Schistocerca piceifrons]